MYKFYFQDANTGEKLWLGSNSYNEGSVYPTVVITGVDGINSKGKTKNIAIESYAESYDKEIWAPLSGALTRELSPIKIKFISSNMYKINFIGFINWITSRKLIYWDTYNGMRCTMQNIKNISWDYNIIQLNNNFFMLSIEFEVITNPVYIYDVDIERVNSKSPIYEITSQSYPYPKNPNTASTYRINTTSTYYIQDIYLNSFPLYKEIIFEIPTHQICSSNFKPETVNIFIKGEKVFTINNGRLATGVIYIPKVSISENENGYMIEYTRYIMRGIEGDYGCIGDELPTI